MITAKERYENLVKNGLAPFFKSKGFKKKGAKFILYKEEVAYAFYPFRGKFNTKDFIDFSLYVDIYTRNFEEKQDLNTFVSFLISINIADIIKDVNYRWIAFKTEEVDGIQKDKEIEKFLLDALEKKVIPFILQFKKVEDIIQVLETTPESEQFWDVPAKGKQTIIKISLYYWLIGQKQKAIETLDKGISSINTLIKVPRLRETVLEQFMETKERILNGPDRYVRESVSALI